MKVVYSAQHLFQIHQFKHLLDTAGITSVIRNEYLMGAAGELPPTECWPKLYVDEAVFDRAELLVKHELDRLSKQDEAVKASWTCPVCGESVESQFEWCWNCAKGSRP
jgi:hypothetical protein